MLSPNNFDEMFDIAEEIYFSADNVSIWPKIILDKSNIDAITNKPANYNKIQLETIDNWPFFRKLPDANLHRGELLLDDQHVTANNLITNSKNKF